MRLRPALRLSAQISLLAAVYAGSDFVAKALHLPLPGNVVGVLVLSLLLFTGVVPSSWVAEGADFLLRHLVLFFVPAVVTVVTLGSVVRGSVVPLLAIVVVTTVAVMLVTGAIAERLARPEQGDP